MKNVTLQRPKPTQKAGARRRVCPRRNKNANHGARLHANSKGMNTALFYLRYLITGYIAFTSIDHVGPLASLIVFVVANVLWTFAEEGLINRRNVRETWKWRNKRK